MSLDFSLHIKEFNSDGYEIFGTTEIFTKNITHNCNKMMIAATDALYDALYNSDGREARDIIPALTYGLTKLTQNQEEIKKLEPSNGWGSYDGLIDFVCDVLGACVKNPNATIYVGR